MTKYNQRYRIESARLQGWNYTDAGYYFVTICTHQQQHFFGKVVAGTMYLSPIGEIVADEWLQTEHVRQHVSLDEWVIMPNHIHGIIVIHEPDTHGDDCHDVETPRRGVSTDAGSL